MCTVSWYVTAPSVLTTVTRHKIENLPYSYSRLATVAMALIPRATVARRTVMAAVLIRDVFALLKVLQICCWSFNTLIKSSFLCKDLKLDMMLHHVVYFLDKPLTIHKYGLYFCGCFYL